MGRFAKVTKVLPLWVWGGGLLAEEAVKLNTVPSIPVTELRTAGQLVSLRSTTTALARIVPVWGGGVGVFVAPGGGVLVDPVHPNPHALVYSPHSAASYVPPTGPQILYPKYFRHDGQQLLPGIAASLSFPGEQPAQTFEEDSLISPQVSLVHELL